MNLKLRANTPVLLYYHLMCNVSQYNISLPGEVNQETLFSLEELAHSEVFNVKSDWSDNITSLRQLAVQKPQVISETFIFQHFTTLRLVDRNVRKL